MALDTKRIMGDPWQLLNVGDFLLIGTYAILALLILQLAGLSLHRFTLWRVTGTPSPVREPAAPINSTEAG